MILAVNQSCHWTAAVQLSVSRINCEKIFGRCRVCANTLTENYLDNWSVNMWNKLKLFGVTTEVLLKLSDVFRLFLSSMNLRRFMRVKPLKSDDLLLFLIISDSKWRVFGFWIVGLTTKDIWRHQERIIHQLILRVTVGLTEKSIGSLHSKRFKRDFNDDLII